MDGTVIWTLPSVQTYVTLPGGVLAWGYLPLAGDGGPGRRKDNLAAYFARPSPPSDREEDPARNRRNP
jgi:hypothetical protein